jgi:hypothetical protein
MATQAAVNPSEETIRIVPLGIHFLLSGEDTNGSVSVFEVTVPGRRKLAAAAHKPRRMLIGADGSPRATHAMAGLSLSAIIYQRESHENLNATFADLAPT